MDRYNFDLFSQFPAEIFIEQEHVVLESATQEYVRRTKDLLG